MSDPWTSTTQKPAETPDLSDVLEPLLMSYGLSRNGTYAKISGRSCKHGAGVKTWTGRRCEVFIYDDNTIGLRDFNTTHGEVSLDLNACDVDFCSKLESWLKATEERDGPIQTP